MKEIHGFGTKYSPFSINQIIQPVISGNNNIGRPLASYKMVAQKLLDLCQTEDTKKKMKRYFI